MKKIKRKMKVVTTLYSYYVYFRRSRAVNSAAGGWVWQKIKLIQIFMEVLVTCKNKVDPFKNEGTRVVTTDLQ